MKLILLGPPGAGKGTQAEVLTNKLNIPAISTGNILRAAVKNETPIGLKAKEYMDAGKLVPDEVIIGVVSERLQEADCANGFILDGVPRTIPQAEALEAAGVVFDKVVSIEISNNEIVERMGGRRVCTSCSTPFHVKGRPPKQEGICDNCGGILELRADDSPEVVLKRLQVYEEETAPLKAFYAERNLLTEVQNQESIEQTTNVILSALGIDKL